MPINVAIVVATMILTTTAIVLLVVSHSRKRAAKEDDLKRAASARGWQFAARTDGGYRVHQWSGTTAGVSWRAESLDYTSRNSRQNRPNISRWHGDWSPGINAPIVCMAVPKGKEIHGTQATPSDSFLGKLAQKAVGFAFDKAIDLYFGDVLGKEVDAGAMHRVDTNVPGYIVMAANKDEGARIAAQGLEQSLASATNDPDSALSSANPPSILLRPKGISLARTSEFRDLNDIERFTRAGLALTRSSKFTRPFA
jgi:hypothetical protein